MILPTAQWNDNQACESLNTKSIELVKKIMIASSPLKCIQR